MKMKRFRIINLRTEHEGTGIRTMRRTRGAEAREFYQANEPNEALEPMRLLVTATAFAVPAPSNRMAQLRR